MLTTIKSTWAKLTWAKLASVLSLSLLCGTAFAHSDAIDPPAPPGSPAAPNERSDRHDADIQLQLDDAQKRLEEAARQVAELSNRMSRVQMERFENLDAPPLSLGRAIVGVQLDPASGKDGARVVEVSPGGPAAVAGMRAGDVIVSVNGRAVTGEKSARQVVRIIRDVQPDTTVTIRALRGGVARDFTVTLRKGPGVVAFDGSFADFPKFPPLPHSFMVEGPLSDMELATLSPHLGTYFGTDKGVLVVRAPPDGVLKLEDGDVILAIDGREPSSGSHATRILGSYQPGEKITLRIVREHKTMELQTTLPDESGRQHKTMVFGGHEPGSVITSDTL